MVKILLSNECENMLGSSPMEWETKVSMAKEGAIKAIILILGNGLNVAAYNHSKQYGIFDILGTRGKKNLA